MNQPRQSKRGEACPMCEAGSGKWGVFALVLVLIVFVVVLLFQYEQPGTSPVSESSEILQLNEQGLPVGYPFQDDWEVTPREVARMMKDGDDFLLLDCREPGEYELTRIEGSKLIPMRELGGRLDEIRDYEDEPIVVVCRSGRRSLEVADMLRRNGFEDVKSMAGGTNLWSKTIDSTVKQY